MTTRTSVAMTGEVARTLCEHLIRSDHQEDVCLALYRPSTGVERWTALLRDVRLPQTGERSVHGNVSFTGDYVLRVAAEAARDANGVAVLHSHPGGQGWQRMSDCDADAERSFAYLVQEITELPLVGMTLAGTDLRWSARTWSAAGKPKDSESVRIVDDTVAVFWNDQLRRAPLLQPSQLRSATAWGAQLQADIARLRVLVVGAGSVGLEVALRLAATGIEHLGVMDFDGVEHLNLDRLIGATLLDALLNRAKTDVARRLLLEATTAARPSIEMYDHSVCEPTGHARALDYDLIISCVDRPWPRAVLNMIAYTDLIPVIDGGIHIDSFPDGGMRSATWRSHVVRPGRPCLACNRQLGLAEVAIDREGLLEDPDYIKGAEFAGRTRQNVALLSVSVVSSLLAQFVSLVAAPGGQGEPGPLQYILSTHTLEHLPCSTEPNCFFEAAVAAGDQRLPLTGRHFLAEKARERRAWASKRVGVRFVRTADDFLTEVRRALTRAASRHLAVDADPAALEELDHAPFATPHCSS